jgi:mRNA-degrading endonuclease RelE of RelBE toxin-antitoxin system
MLNVEYKDEFLKFIGKIKHQEMKVKTKKQIEKIVENPEIGKPMQYGRKGTREIYISPYRLAYAYYPDDERLIFLAIYHKDEQ